MNNEIPKTMKAVVLTGHGGFDKLEYREDIPVPTPGANDVLIKVGACGMNNTDINTRTAWYSKTVTEGTTTAGGADGFNEITEHAAAWGGSAIEFPRIQGADVAGTIVAVGANVSCDRIGERVIVDGWLRDKTDPDDRTKAGYYGSERDGGYAEYTTAPAINAFSISSNLSDAELATFPCSYSTAEYMLTRAELKDGESIVITGASGGVGSALVQLAKRRGAFVVAITSPSKIEQIRNIGADVAIARDAKDLEQDIRDALPDRATHVAADIVGGAGFTMLVNLLKRGGRYVTSGAIAGPIVEVDLRTLYLHDLSFLGATVMPRFVFENLVHYIENDEIRPLLAKTFPLSDLLDAQAEFLEKKHVGNFVVIP